jgi:hypothetical protein
MPLDLCRIIELPKITDPRGNLTFLESGRHIPFETKRVYYLYARTWETGTPRAS